MKKLRLIIQTILILAAGIFIGAKFWPEIAVKTPAANFAPLRAPQTNFKLINPLIGFDTSQNQNFPEFSEIKKEINDFINDEKSAKRLETIGFYGRNLTNGHWFGINENQNFEPASLFKLPVMMAYFKKAEREPAVLAKKIHYFNPNKTSGEDFVAAPSELESGKDYTIDELIKAMIVKSDNGAKDILLNYVGGNYLTEVFNDLGIQFPNDKNYGISPKQYGYFFRRLHNATFLNRELSEKALEILSETEFKDGLAAGVPEGVLVAHKFGEYGTRENGQITAELHDCGIIYYPKDRYLLCAMTKGYDIGELKKIIATITAIVSKNIGN